ncbi:S66 peptidase family protein [Halobium salinum]|uniref:S66 peptidase family protein n=1 Tax=Halobium salinum TaxID=1364940 RepID=A0ABD5P9Y7_9EURY|nr:S66 peptidase family protein [Halobium salinum]
MPSFTVPPALEPGDTLAVLAPSRPPAEPWFSVALDRLRETFGLDPVVYPTAERVGAEEPVPPAERATEIERAFADPEVRGVMAVTGGDDQIRVLRHLDADVLRENPTRFYGFSDNDNLRLYLWNLGIVSYAAQLMPTLALDPDLHPYTERYLRRALFEDGLGVVDPAEEWTDGWYEFDGEPREWRPTDGHGWWLGPDADAERAVEGRVWGGCYSIVSWHLETSRYLPDPDDFDGAVLALETSETLPDAADVGYTLRSMGERGLLERFDGVLVGRPKSFNPRVDRDRDFEEYRSDIRDAVTTQLAEYAPDAVAVFDVDFGHTDPHVPLPLGGLATLDARENQLRVD